MLRVVVTEAGHDALPPIDVDGAFVIGSAPAARIRIPAARAEHVRVDGTRWRTAEGEGAIGEGVELAIGSFRVRIAPAPAGAVAASPQRTESLARELVRSLLGAGGAPTLEVERGPVVGAKRALAPPESVLVIGRGDDAGWVILDEDLSKRHAEVRRGWDGVRIVDLDSKNATKVEGIAVRERELRDGATIELGKVVLRFRDPAESHLGAPAASPRSAPVARPSRGPFYLAATIAALAIAGLVWILAS